VSGLPEHSVLNVTQIATIARGALEAKISAGHDWLLAQIDTDLTTTLGLTRP
jgi:mRNA-degrading endonuclease toxin of MazEF toxin-antitoxin module